VIAALTGRLFVWPATDPPGQVDAVLVFAGGEGERAATGIGLVRRGVAPVLVISDGGRPGSRSAWACHQPLGFRIVCVTPDESSTQAEASAFTELAEREGWRSVVLVTSTYHLRRASLLMGRCYDGTILTASAPPRRSVARLAPPILHEWAGVLVALTVRRSC
jgi:uncharacterized SAM-binding protein YcdF (DUF218 family)